MNQYEMQLLSSLCNLVFAKEWPHLRMEIDIVDRIDFCVGSMAPGALNARFFKVWGFWGSIRTQWVPKVSKALEGKVLGRVFDVGDGAAPLYRAHSIASLVRKAALWHDMGWSPSNAWGNAWKWLIQQSFQSSGPHIQCGSGQETDCPSLHLQGSLTLLVGIGVLLDGLQVVNQPQWQNQM